MQATIHLVRHAAHGKLNSVLCGRMPGVGLSEEGRWQAEWLAQRLAREPVAAVQASPRERARQTADPVAARHGMAVETVEALDELDAGGWTGKSFAELEDDPAWRRWNAARAFARAPDGEDAHSVQARTVGHLLAAAEALRGQSIVMVSHAEPIRLALLALLGLGPDAWTRIEIAPASISTVSIGASGARLLRLNEEPPA